MRPSAPRRAPPFLRNLTLLLSGRCTFSCDYCYQRVRSCAERLSWEDARAALDRLLASKARVRAVEFSGGEPLLAWDLLVRCVEHAEARNPRGRVLQLLLTTNGMLLAPERLAWLEEHGFFLRLSFDGPEAQARRCEGSFRRLDSLLDEMRRLHPPLFSRLRVHAAVLPSTVDALSESAAYFLAKGVREIYFYPVAGSGEPWPLQRLAELCSQTGEISALSVRRFEQTGDVPVLFLRAGAPEGPGCPDGEAFCGASRGDGFCVDPDGRAWSCPFFAASLAEPGAAAQEAVRAVDLGAVAGPRFASRLAALPARASAVRLLAGRERMRSGYRACAHCEFLPECGVCPAAESAEGDPGRVSDFACAFSMATLEARRTFAQRTAGAEREAQLRRLRRAAAALADALREAGQ